MLPPHLQYVKEMITGKSPARRSVGEKSLLDELEALDALIGAERLGRALNEAGVRTMITSGPAGQCPCCGK